MNSSSLSNSVKLTFNCVLDLQEAHDIIAFDRLAIVIGPGGGI
jgi:hypothetical protein